MKFRLTHSLPSLLTPAAISLDHDAHHRTDTQAIIIVEEMTVCPRMRQSWIIFASEAK